MRIMVNLFLIILSMTFTTSAFAGNPFKSSTEKLRLEIIKSLNKIEVSDYNLTEDSIALQFIINNDNEMVVLSTNNSKLDELIKTTLNYKELEINDMNVKKFSLYSINVKLEKKNPDVHS